MLGLLVGVLLVLAIRGLWDSGEHIEGVNEPDRYVHRGKVRRR